MIALNQGDDLRRPGRLTLKNNNIERASLPVPDFVRKFDEGLASRRTPEPGVSLAVWVLVTLLIKSHFR